MRLLILSSSLLANEPNPVGLLLVDVDKFKDINDSYGHIMGDKTLCRVAWLLQHAFRTDDFAFAWVEMNLRL